MENICYIVGASGENFENFIPNDGDLIIASDGGYEQLIKKGYTPDILIGDVDSLDISDVSCKVIRHPVMKDDTDTILCIKYGMEKGYKNFVIYGGLGGKRISHSYANIQALAFIKDSGCFGKLISENCEIFMLENSKIEFDKGKSGHVSVFSYTNRSCGVSEKGLKYEITDVEISNRFPIGVSNSFTGAPSFISVKDGTLLIILES